MDVLHIFGTFFQHNTHNNDDIGPNRTFGMVQIEDSPKGPQVAANVSQ